MEIGLKTGRRHQIRKHCAHLRHPIVGDVRYGDGKLNLLFRKHFGLHRLLLFATSLQFTHPITQQELHIQFDPSKEDAIVRTFFERYQLIISQ
jgi:tRNA pseudouridine65 synthase